MIVTQQKNYFRLAGIRFQRPQQALRWRIRRQAVRPGGPKKAGTGDDVDSALLYLANKLKNNRFRDEAKLKLLKWNFAAPRPEFVDQFKEQVEKNEEISLSFLFLFSLGVSDLDLQYFAGSGPTSDPESL